MHRDTESSSKDSLIPGLDRKSSKINKIKKQEKKEYYSSMSKNYPGELVVVFSRLITHSSFEVVVQDFIRDYKANHPELEESEDQLRKNTYYHFSKEIEGREVDERKVSSKDEFFVKFCGLEPKKKIQNRKTKTPKVDKGNHLSEPQIKSSQAILYGLFLQDFLNNDDWFEYGLTKFSNAEEGSKTFLRNNLEIIRKVFADPQYQPKFIYKQKDQ